jgi:hypothetical protein
MKTEIKKVLFLQNGRGWLEINYFDLFTFTVPRNSRDNDFKTLWSSSHGFLTLK